jgi:hypothetical protein
MAQGAVEAAVDRGLQRRPRDAVEGKRRRCTEAAAEIEKPPRRRRRDIAVASGVSTESKGKMGCGGFLPKVKSVASCRLGARKFALFFCV